MNVEKIAITGMNIQRVRVLSTPATKSFDTNPPMIPPPIHSVPSSQSVATLSVRSSLGMAITWIITAKETRTNADDTSLNITVSLFMLFLHNTA